MFFFFFSSRYLIVNCYNSVSQQLLNRYFYVTNNDIVFLLLLFFSLQYVDQISSLVLFIFFLPGTFLLSRVFSFLGSAREYVNLSTSACSYNIFKDILRIKCNI